MKLRIALLGIAALIAAQPATAGGQLHDAIHYCQPHEADQPELIIASCLKAIDSNLLDRMALTQAWNNVGAAHLELKQYDEAAAAFGHAIDSDPKMWRPYANRANVEAELGKLDAAEADINTAIALAPNEPGPVRTRGQLFLVEGKLDQAIADFTTAIANDSDDAPAYGLRARAYEKQGKHDLAEADRVKLKKLDPDNKYGLMTPQP